MKKHFFIFILFCFNYLFSQTITDPLNILFVGNSITYYNNLPQTFEQISNEQGMHVNIDQHTPGGTGFIHHVNNNSLYEKFRDRIWDYVILQPGSNESIGYSETIENTTIRAQRLKDSIVKYSPCARIYYYEISYGIVSDTPESLQQYYDRQTIIKNNLTQMGNATDIPFIPAGECFKTSMQTNENQFLWGNYMNIHPNAKGSYLAACSFYNALFKVPIQNTSVLAGLNETDATYLRNQAENTTLNHLDDWLINDYTATANFSYNSNNNIVSFINASTNYDSLNWNFGDGSTSTQENPIHDFDFSSENEYTIVLTAYKDCKAHHKVLKITQNLLAIKQVELLEHSFIIYPNPTKNTIHLKTTQLVNNTHITIYDLLGSKINPNKYTFIKQNNTINLSRLDKGIYIIQFKIDEKLISKRIIKN